MEENNGILKTSFERIAKNREELELLSGFLAGHRPFFEEATGVYGIDADVRPRRRPELNIWMAPEGCNKAASMAICQHFGGVWKPVLDTGSDKFRYEGNVGEIRVSIWWAECIAPKRHDIVFGPGRSAPSPEAAS